jgi:molybdopterin converting factor small subunit
VAELILTRALAAQVNNQLQHEVDGANVREALESVFAAYPQLRRYLLTDGGAVRQHVNVFLNETLIEDRRGLSDAVSSGDTIHVIQAVSGGSA